jgi:hypothetical protein
MTPESPRVAGRYEIHRLLGRGGMASVHLARQPALDREVALKELHSAHVADPAFARRFLYESRVGGALNHPSVVTVIEYFEHEGVPFIALEYLERGSLRPLVGRLTLAQVAGVLDSVLAGLAEAATQGIVHRDLKPENVLVTADGHAKIADFGIAKAIGQVCMTDFRTATGQIVGTPAYMAPEQVSGGEITSQVDLYATGLIAYELLAGRHPFHDTDAPMALLMRHLNDAPPPLADVRPDLPPGVVAWVHSMLAKEPDARPAGAAHAWDRLEGVVSDELGPRWRRAATLTEPGAEVAPAVEIEPAPRSEMSGIYSVVLPPVQADATEPEPEPIEPHAPRRPRRRALALALAGALLLAVATIMYSTAPGEEPRAAQLPPAGPSLETRLRETVTPALRADARLSKELSSLDPGASPARALARVAVALPATDTALSDVRELPATDAADERLLRDRATRALRTQTDYLEVVRAALRLQADAEQLDAFGRLSARLVSRLERIETAVPGASGSVGGARRLKQWVLAEIAATQAPPATVPAAPAAPPAQPQPEPAPIATATPTPAATATPEATPTPGTPDEAHSFRGEARIQPRRARLRNRLETRAARGARVPGAAG